MMFIRRKSESFEDYQANIFPKLFDSQFMEKNVGWIREILAGRREAENILLQNENFVLLPDSKHLVPNKLTKKPEFHLLGIVKRADLFSIRDLTSVEIPYLMEIVEKSLTFIEQRYHLNRSDIRVFFHYYPSVFHLHIHFVLKSRYVGFGDHDFVDVIKNLEKDSFFYKGVLEVCSK